VALCHGAARSGARRMIEGSRLRRIPIARASGGRHER
jgi:hypothetical protein